MSPLDETFGEWGRKGASLSDKTARKEFGLTQEEIYRAIEAGELHYVETAIWGNPYLKLLRREVEALVARKHGGGYLQDRKTKTEIAAINRELKSLKARIAELEERKATLTAGGARTGGARK